MLWENIAKKVIERRLMTLHRIGITILIEPVSRCNLSCIYCAADGYKSHKQPLRVIDRKTIDDLLEKLSDFAERYNVRGEILMHGYEPLQAGIELFEYVQDKMRETGLEYRFLKGVQTNATLIDEQWADFFWRYRWSVGVSIDGPKEQHDANRIFVNGKGSYDLAIRGALLIKEKTGRFPGVISVITKAHMKPSIKEGVRRYYQWLEEYDIRSANLHWPAYDPRNPFIKRFLPSIDELIDWFVEMYKLWASKHDGRKLHPYDSIIEGFVRGRTTHGACLFRNGCWRVIGIDYRGIVHLCDRWSYVMKKITEYKRFEEIFYDPEMLKQAARVHMLRLYDPECSKCKYFNICQGGCANEAVYRSIVEKGIMGVPQWNRTQYCKLYKALFKVIEEDLKERGAVALNT